jgi:predicted TPR repeat methyltransferase
MKQHLNNTNEQTIEAYNKSVDAYIKNTPPKVDGHIQTWLDKCIDHLNPSSKILEIGVGHGKDADYLESKGFSVERTDASLSFVDYQKSKGHEAKVLNVLTDKIVDNYDMVLADAVWLHFTPEEAKSATDKVFNALNPNGIFAFSVKEGEGTELTDRKLHYTRYFCYWNETDIKKLLLEVGFNKIRITNATDYRPDRPGWLLIISEK